MQLVTSKEVIQYCNVTFKRTFPNTAYLHIVKQCSTLLNHTELAMSAVTQIISPHWKRMTYRHFVTVNCCKCECWHFISYLGAVKIQFRLYVWLYTQSILAERCWFSGFYYHWRCVFFGFFRLCTVDFENLSVSHCLSHTLSLSTHVNHSWIAPGSEFSVL